MKINCVVVTYNRLALLKECVQALKAQTLPPTELWIIDNCSTDGTKEWLDSLKGDSKLHVVRTERNIGGAGGFALGTKLAVEAGCDFVWLMDDDTMPRPDALKLLAKVAAADDKTGFVCSKVLWTDGTLHAMNKPALVEKPFGGAEALTVGGETCFACKLCSFVSVMVSSDAVRKVGLPIKEFFIWCDDIEYTDRIKRVGYECYFVPASQVYHKTRQNYFPSIDKAPNEMAGRFYYQVRNTCYLKRRSTNKLKFYISVLNKYRLYMHRLKRRDDQSHIAEFKKAVIKGCLDGLHFNPTIEYIKD